MAAAEGGRQPCPVGGEEWPEKILSTFAMWTVIQEKVALTVGRLAFIWATVVLLGGFASALKPVDFWFVTVILVAEGIRIFSRSHELECERHTLLSSGPERNDDDPRWHLVGATRPVNPWWESLTRKISGFFYCVQFVSLVPCMVLPIARLTQHDFCDVEEGTSTGDGCLRNLSHALNIFYALSFVEATFSLLRKLYFEWTIRYCQRFESVRNKCRFCPNSVVTMKHFFYYAYLKCRNVGVLVGLQEDLVSYAQELLTSNMTDKQLTASRILRKFINTYTVDRFPAEEADQSARRRRKNYTLRQLESNSLAVEKLVHMLGWERGEEEDELEISQREEMQRSAAEIVCELVSRGQLNAVRVASITGSNEPMLPLLVDELNRRAARHP